MRSAYLTYLGDEAIRSSDLPQTMRSEGFAMTEERSREVLENSHEYWDIAKDDVDACLDGCFTADQLEAIAFCLRNKIDI